MGLRDERRIDTQARIAGAARALLDEHGFHGTTFRAIAARAGVSVGTVHNYAGSKAALVVDLLVDDLEATIAERGRHLPTGDLKAQLIHLFGGFFVLYAARPALARTYIQESMFAPEAAFGRYLDLTARFLQQLADRCAASGELRPDVDPLLAAQILLDGYLWVVVMWLRTETPDVSTATAALDARLTQLLQLFR